MNIGTVSVVWIDPPPDDVEEYWWNLWYNAKHGPERFRLPGIMAWRRFQIVPGVPAGLSIPGEYKYFTLSDQRDNSVLSSEAGRALVTANLAEAKDPNTGEALHLSGARWVSDSYEHVYSPANDYEPPFTDYLLVVGHDVPADREAAFDSWIKQEHLEQLAALPGYIAARHFQPAAGYSHPRVAHRTDRSSPTRLTLCDLEHAEALESTALDGFGEPSGVTLSKCQLYKRFYPYVGFKHVSTLS